MAVLPVPELVKDMAAAVDQISRAVAALNAKLDKLADKIGSMKCQEDEVRTMALKMESMSGALSVAKDQLAMLCAMVEKGNGMARLHESADAEVKRGADHRQLGL